MKKNLGAVASSIRNKFADTFNRTDTTGSLGTASDGSLWKALRGTWKVTSNKAQSTDAANTYPAVSVVMPNKATSISIQGPVSGSGALIWVTDANNWWAVDLYQSTYSTPNYTTNYNGTFCDGGYNNNAYYVCNYSVANYCYATNYAGPYCGAWNSNNIRNAAYCRYYYYNSYTYSYACGNTCLSSYYAGPTFVCTSGPTPKYYTYQSGTSYFYPQFLRVLQSVGNVVSQIASLQVSDNATINGLRALISGTTVTARAYSDVNMTSQVGSDLVYNATGAAVTTEYGLLLTPAAYNQGNAVDDIVVE
jgi:hypothetical protein